MLVLAIGAHPEREWPRTDVLTYHDGRDGPDYRLLLHQLREGRVNSVAFVKPAGPSWPLPLYDLALLTAADCAAHGRSEVDLSLITPEAEPLAIFGSAASAAIRGLLHERGVTLHTSSYGVPGPPGLARHHRPATGAVPVDRIVTEPRLVGPRLRGIPCDATASSTPTPTAGSPAWTACSRPVTRRPSRSSRAAWPPSRPTPSPR